MNKTLLSTSAAILLGLGTLVPAWAATQAPDGFVYNEDVVTRVEQHLSSIGYPIQPDGQYDANLRNNVLRYQAENGLRPTGDIDLSTLGKMGIAVDMKALPSNQAAMVPPPAQHTAVIPPSQTVAQLPPSYGYPMLRDDHMSSPQVRDQAAPLENSAGLTVPAANMPTITEIAQGEQPPGFPPGYPTQDLY